MEKMVGCKYISVDQPAVQQQHPGDRQAQVLTAVLVVTEELFSE
jgi:hypothetical protein